jgi:hypothetical protein
LIHIERWLSAEERDLESEARALADRLQEREVRFRSVRTFDYAGQPARSIVFDIGGSDFALVPAGSYAIGFDLDSYVADADVKKSYAGSVRELGYPRVLKRYLEDVLTKPSRIEVPAMLLEVTARQAGYVPVATDNPAIAKVLSRLKIRGSYEESGRFRIEERDGGYAAWMIRSASRAELVHELRASGFRLATASEWDVACGAGRSTLFRWGNTCPLNCGPIDEVIYNPSLGIKRFALHEVPNAFGLNIARDPYKTELVAEPNIVRGGDGGAAVCGDYGTFLAWLPLASAYADAETSRSLLSDDVTGHWYRRVLEIR